MLASFKVTQTLLAGLMLDTSGLLNLLGKLEKAPVMCDRSSTLSTSDILASLVARLLILVGCIRIVMVPHLVLERLCCYNTNTVG